MFELDPRLKQDTIDFGSFPLCRVLLLNDCSYPWFILVPRRASVTEIYQLEEPDQQRLWQESAILARWMSATFEFAKLNVAALGNVVSQLHLHHVGRSIGDLTWPGPVWGQHPPQPYTVEEIEKIKQQVSANLAAYWGEEQ